KGIFANPTRSGSTLRLKDAVIVSADNISNVALTNDQEKRKESFEFLKSMDDDYKNNELAAVEKWQNKRVNITFVFQNARKRSSGVAVSGYVKNGGKTIDITAELLLKYLNKLKNYKGGESVTVSGIMSKPTCAWYSYRSMFKVTLKDAKVIR
ncbi:MAG: hypothetical protein GY730_11965, partial [bacterium]|nr:hypothetical protein [bacterium]